MTGPTPGHARGRATIICAAGFLTHERSTATLRAPDMRSSWPTGRPPEEETMGGLFATPPPRPPLLPRCVPVAAARAQVPQVPQGYPADYGKIVEAAKKEAKVVIYSTTDAVARTR